MKVVRQHAISRFAWLTSGHQSVNPSRETIARLSGKYKRFTFVHPVIKLYENESYNECCSHQNIIVVHCSLINKGIHTIAKLFQSGFLLLLHQKSVPKKISMKSKKYQRKQDFIFCTEVSMPFLCTSVASGKLLHSIFRNPHVIAVYTDG